MAKKVSKAAATKLRVEAAGVPKVSADVATWAEVEYLVVSITACQQCWSFDLEPLSGDRLEHFKHLPC